MCAAAVVMCGNEMVATSMGARWLEFSYRPSYLGLVVGPLMEDIVHGLRVPPSVFFVNGTGRDHARGAGVAIQLGAAFDVPTIGITNRPILAVGPEPPTVLGSWAPLEVDGRVVACRVRTATAGRPVTLHAGWRTSPEVARDCASSIDQGVSLPRPMVRACHLARALRSRVPGQAGERARAGSRRSSRGSGPAASAGRGEPLLRRIACSCRRIIGVRVFGNLLTKRPRNPAQVRQRVFSWRFGPHSRSSCA